MSTPGGTRTRAGVSAPEKGAFPLDHFKECSDIISSYMSCLSKHELMPKRCQKLQVDYLNCRMENGLMKKEALEDLGFTKQNSYETEIEEKRALFMKYSQLQEEARLNVESWLESNRVNKENQTNK